MYTCRPSKSCSDCREDSLYSEHSSRQEASWITRRMENDPVRYLCINERNTRVVFSLLVYLRRATLLHLRSQPAVDISSSDPTAVASQGREQACQARISTSIGQHPHLQFCPIRHRMYHTAPEWAYRGDLMTAIKVDNYYVFVYSTPPTPCDNNRTCFKSGCLEKTALFGEHRPCSPWKDPARVHISKNMIFQQYGVVRQKNHSVPQVMHAENHIDLKWTP